MTKFRERLNKACSLAKESLVNAQQGMKRNFDRKAVTRSFMPGDSVLVFYQFQDLHFLYVSLVLMRLKRKLTKQIMLSLLLTENVRRVSVM